MSSRVKFNPFTGEFDLVGDAVPAVSAFAEAIKVTRTASETMSALTAVKADSPTNVSRATFDSTFEDANVFGITLTAVTVGNDVEIFIFGGLSDSFFNGFTLNDQIFLGLNGVLTQTRPASGSGFFLSELGKSLGGDTVFIDIQQPIELV